MRQFISSKAPDKKGLLEISGKDFRYLRNVLRLSCGDMFPVRIPGGTLINTTVCKIIDSEKKIVLQICDVISSESESANIPDFTPETEFWLFQFVARSQKMDVIIRQAVECGVSRIIPVSGDFSQAGAAEKNFRNERFERIIREARQQSGSAVETFLESVVSVDQAAEMWRNYVSGAEDAFSCVLYERNDRTVELHSAVGKYQSVRKCAVVCGAEGGISPEELIIFENAGFVPVHFKTNILRCETAALYGMAVLQNLITEKSIWQLKE